ncbi:DUF853 domain-containing protein [Magnetospira thiophila]
MDNDSAIFLGLGDGPVHLNLRYANRHGLITGATGTGKTVTLQCLVEGFSSQGVPVFLADVKGDLSGLCMAGKTDGKLGERAAKVGLSDYRAEAFPTVFWDVYGQLGHPIRTTVSEMGPLLLGRLLDLNDIQEGVLQALFALADDQGLALLDLKDLRALLNFAQENRKELEKTYGSLSSASVAAILRQLLVLERSGADGFFGEPALDVAELIRGDRYGKGLVHILQAAELARSPRLYSAVLLWLLSELFEDLPEIGDPDKPKLVLIFDEAHMMFDDAPRVLLQQVEQVVRLIRSKGVGVYFVTQNPLDIPSDVAGQLGNRILHALRAFTEKDRKAVRAVAQSFRENPAFDAEQVLTELGLGEALVTTIEKKGTPTIVQRTLLRPPCSRIGMATPDEQAAGQKFSPYAGRYETALDRESAYEILSARADQAARTAAESETRMKETRAAPRPTSRSSNRQGVGEALVKSAVRAVGSRLGREIVRGLLGSLFKGR